MNYNACVDGEDIAAIGMKARTRTGRRLSLSGGIAFNTPDQGRFACFTGYICMRIREAMAEPLSAQHRESIRKAVGDTADVLLAGVIHRLERIPATELADAYLTYLETDVFPTEPERIKALVELGILDPDTQQPPSQDMWALAVVNPQARRARMAKQVCLLVADMGDELMYTQAPDWMLDALGKFATRHLNTLLERTVSTPTTAKATSS